MTPAAPPAEVPALLAEISGIGRDPAGGWSRHVFTAEDAALRAWFGAQAEARGMTVEGDRDGNLWAWWGTPAGPGERAVATGSHLDSVPGGGQFDGPLGVASALAAVDRLVERGALVPGRRPARPLALVVFAEEEGSRFGLACLGTRLLTGAAEPGRVRALVDRDGVDFATAASAAGLDPKGIGADPGLVGRLGAFVELHVEQGIGLGELGRPVGVAGSVLAHGRWHLRFAGEGNHAGATRMTDRRDPMVPAAATVLAARRAATAPAALARQARATVGRLTPTPGGTNVVAASVDLWLDLRALEEADVMDLLGAVRAAAEDATRAEGCTLEVVQESFSPATHFDPELRDRMAGLLGDAPVLATGAGHDAAVLAEAGVVTGMLFVRNPTGVSHAEAESAAAEDCAEGVGALADVLAALLAGEGR